MPYRLLGRTVDERARAGARLRGDGIEIGACHTPLAVDTARARVRYVDRLSAREILEHFPELRGETLVDADVRCDVATERLSRFDSESLDFVIASHVLEHVPDPLGLFLDAHRVLRDGGLFYLGLPDKDYTFDKDRAVTPLVHLINDLRNRTTSYDPYHFEDHLENAAKLPVPRDRDEYQAVFARELGRSFHVHVWTWRGVVELVRYMIADGGAPFELVELYCPKGVQNEVIVLLRKRALSPRRARLSFDFKLALLRSREIAVELLLKASRS